MKKFTSVMLGVFILCFAAVANAANEHPAKAEHFSMLELNRKLSALILEKYPNTHIDSTPFSIIACNSQFTKDASIDNHSCLDSSIKPRPDSADFALHLSVGIDFDHQQKIIYSSDSFDVSKSVTGKRYNFKVLPKRTAGEQPGVPYESWTYVAFYKLVKAGITEPVRSLTGPSLLMATRYEFAVAMARLLDKKSERAKDAPEVKELIGELAIEFAPEIAYLSMRGGGLDSKDERASKPRYEFLQLQFQSGSKFDKKLQEQIENIIADYAAAWLKSNSSADADAQKYFIPVSHS